MKRWRKYKRMGSSLTLRQISICLGFAVVLAVALYECFLTFD